ncbi:MAG: acyl-CoA dehydrogenase family protein, partial [Pseudomonadales bacterium]
MEQVRDFGFGEEQAMLKDSARRFMADKVPLTLVRQSTKGTEDPYLGEERSGVYDKAAWQEMVELGWPALAVPEEAGGLGMSLVTAVAIAEEIGQAAMPTPLTSTLLATFVLRHAASLEHSQAAKTWLARIAEGSSAALAIQGAADPLALDSTEVTAADGKLPGTAWFIQDLQKVDFLIVAAKEGDALQLYGVDVKSDGVELAFDRIVDLTRDQGRATFNQAPAELLAKDGRKALHD